MPRSKIALLGVAVVAAGLVAPGGQASAAQWVAGTYNCLSDTTPPIVHNGVAVMHYRQGTSVAPGLYADIAIDAIEDADPYTVTTTVKTSAGNFGGAVHGDWLQRGDTPILAGPLPHAGPVSFASLPLGSGTPSATNWQLSVHFPTSSATVYCVRTSVTGSAPGLTILTW